MDKGVVGVKMRFIGAKVLKIFSMYDRFEVYEWFVKTGS